MKKYRVIYIIAIEIEAENDDEVLDMVAENYEYDDFFFVDAEFEEVE